MDIKLLNVFVPIFSLIFIGYITGRFSKVQKSTIKALSDLTLYILVPALIITSLAKITLTSVFLLIVLSAIFIVFVTAILAYIISKIKKLKDSCACSETAGASKQRGSSFASYYPGLAAFSHKSENIKIEHSRPEHYRKNGLWPSIGVCFRLYWRSSGNSIWSGHYRFGNAHEDNNFPYRSEI